MAVIATGGFGTSGASEVKASVSVDGGASMAAGARRAMLASARPSRRWACDAALSAALSSPCACWTVEKVDAAAAADASSCVRWMIDWGPRAVLGEDSCASCTASASR